MGPACHGPNNHREPLYSQAYPRASAPSRAHLANCLWIHADWTLDTLAIALFSAPYASADSTNTVLREIDKHDSKQGDSSHMLGSYRQT